MIDPEGGWSGGWVGRHSFQTPLPSKRENNKTHFIGTIIRPKFDLGVRGQSNS